ncbi:MAG TPA: GSCFA domain-containing protein [Hymenobacter sp.]|uniref:GSCFA domain-containing protein n=1 Tax=Hymenobacter sp. TaxID=1898978 RepID=UPI002D802B64|nr:GSCFA domain-containing protein [Hymenobacter sp.]HET9502873.1 GSCFA domain-containing protein [Hymenobacter sp.]
MFRTELTIAPQERLLPRTARVLTVGSCFADSIGERLRLNKVNALVNPFGTVFQPLALAQLLRAAAGEEQDWQQHVVEARGRWQSYDFHSTVGAESPVELLQTIQEKVRQVGEFIRTADAVVLTLGTAWAYRLRETGELVSNLHKLPAGLFEKELLTADEIVNGLAEVHALLRRLNPNIRIVLTVSPVRHIKDTLPLNAVSKSVLRVACHYLSELLPNVSYFPAYELLTDDLRDYRFYAADMLHPSEVAEDYIWERFARAYFDTDFGRFRKEWAAVRQSLGHRPLHIGAPEHRTFLDQTHERLERLTSQGVDVRQELRDVQRQLAALPPPRPARVVEELEDDGEERIDIGDGTPTMAATGTSEQPDRRNDRTTRRDGRDNRRSDRNNRDRRDNRPVPTALPAAEELVLPTEEVAEESVVASAEALLVSPEAELLLPTLEGTEAYPAKKKKRRSRGGAKRTARKNAARLAGEQGSVAAPEGEDDTDELETATESVDASIPDAVFSEPFSLAELPAADTASPETTDFEVAADQPEIDATEPPADAEPAATEQPATVRRRGTGPTPKKSKVITKSGLVKRGQRGSLYRTPTPAPEETGTPTLGAAPIISSPIIPEVLLERPANNLASSPEPAAEPDLAATVLGLYATKPKASVATTQPKRGRPKAATTNPPPTDTAPTTTVAPDASAPAPAAVASSDAATPVASEVVPVEAVAPAATAEPATTEAAPVPTEAAPAKAAAKAKKPAARPAKAKAAKPTAAKKPAAKPAAAKKTTATTTARRGRPPGKKAAPDAPDAPAA